MRVICSVCGAFGRITKTNRLSHNVADLYCQCTEP
ncbi:ogr/Delta-like zinc finger family protein, partial [Aeromonas schubertii]